MASNTTEGSAGDREQVKAHMLELIARFTRSRRQNVLALVVYGPPDSQSSTQWHEIRREIDRLVFQAASAAVQWIPLQFPQLRDRLYANLEYELETQLSGRPGEVMQAALHRVAPLASSGSHRILWLDWGTFGDWPGHRCQLTHHELQTWLQFCSDFLAAHVPRGVRVVSYLAVETESCNDLGVFLARQLNEPWCKKADFRLKSLRIE